MEDASNQAASIMQAVFTIAMPCVPCTLHHGHMAWVSRSLLESKFGLRRMQLGKKIMPRRTEHHTQYPMHSSGMSETWSRLNLHAIMTAC